MCPSWRHAKLDGHTSGTAARHWATRSAPSSAVGSLPFIATSLFAGFGSSWAITGYFVVIALISLGSILALPKDPQQTEELNR